MAWFVIILHNSDMLVGTDDDDDADGFIKVLDFNH